MQVLACVQNLPQLLSLYGEQSPLLASFHTSLFYRPLPTDRVTSEFLEAALGQTTVIAQSWSETQGTSWGLSTASASRSTSSGGQERPRALLTSEEIRRLGSSDALVLASGCAPILARKLGTPRPTLPTRCGGRPLPTGRPVPR